MATPDDIAARKRALREPLLAARRARPSSELEVARAALCDVVLQRVTGLTCVAAYEPLPTEPGSVELLAALVARGVRVLVPATLPDRDLDWVEWRPSGSTEMCGPDAIGAPSLVLAPALAVAADGTRLGRGGGSYDRALARRAPGATVAALVFDEELVAELPRAPWDVPVDAVATPSGWREIVRNTDVPPPR